MIITPPPPLIRPSDRVEQTVIRFPLPMADGRWPMADDNHDYPQHEEELRRMDEVFVRSGVEAACIAQAITAVVVVRRRPGQVVV